MKQITTLFIGTSNEGLTTLEALHAHKGFTVPAVITQPDRPAGRKQELQPTPVKEKALKLGIEVLTPDEEDVYKKALKAYNPDLAITIAYGNFIPSHFLDSLPLKCLNIHYSLLPQLRGAVPVQMAILQGLTETGVTIQVMEETMDTGPIIASEKVPIAPDETTPSLKQKLIPTGKDLLMRVLPKWVSGEIAPIEQNPEKATYCYMEDISKEKAEIDWATMNPEYIEQMIRAFQPWPIAWTKLPDERRLRIFQAEISQIRTDLPPGSMLPNKDQILFATKQPNIILNVTDGQIEGKKRMDGKALRQGLKNPDTRRSSTP